MVGIPHHPSLCEAAGQGAPPDLRLKLADMDKKLDLLSAQVGECLDNLHAIVRPASYAQQRRSAKTAWAPSPWPAPDQIVKPLALPVSLVDRAASNESHTAVNTSPRQTISRHTVTSNSPGPTHASPRLTASDRSNTMQSTVSNTGTRVGGLLTEQQTKSWSKVVQTLERRKTRHPVLSNIWTFLEDAESSQFARWYSAIMPFFTLCTVVITLLQTVQPPIFGQKFAALLETSFDTVFALEVVLRLATCPNHRAFFFSFYNLIDVLAIAPFFLRASIGFELPEEESLAKSLLLCFAPLIRLLKTLRRFQKIQLLWNAFALALEALPVLMYTAFIVNLAFSAIIFLVEPRWNMPTLGSAMWLTLVTMMTVGYGDETPVSREGTYVVSVLIVCSVLYMAIPLGIVGQIFGQVWEQRDRILLMQKTHRLLLDWGYSAHDVPMLFDVFDSDDDGKLTLDEFQMMIELMDIGIPNSRVRRLFDTMDSDGNGTITDAEFVKSLFGQEYHDIFAPISARIAGGDDAWSPIRQQDSESLIRRRRKSTAQVDAQLLHTLARKSVSCGYTRTSLARGSLKLTGRGPPPRVSTT